MEEPEKKHYPERWSGITPNDLGLQAAYWTGNEGEPVIFRAIIGWITYTTDEPNPPHVRNGLSPIVLGDNWWPVLAMGVSNYAGVVPKGLTPSDALVRIKQWRGQAEPSSTMRRSSA